MFNLLTQPSLVDAPGSESGSSVRLLNPGLHPAAGPGTGLDRVEVDQARLGDWLGICKLVADNFPLETEQRVGFWLCHHLPFIHVARHHGEVIGFFHVQRRVEENMLWVNMIAVAEHMRGQGVAQKLLARVEQVAAACGLGRIGLQCLDTNLAALKIYERTGYQRTGTGVLEPYGLGTVQHAREISADNREAGRQLSVPKLQSRLVRSVYRLIYLGWTRYRSPIPE